jgi:predicted acetyltransferase
VNELRLSTAAKSEAAIIGQLMQRYLAEFAEFTEVKKSKDGLYVYDYLDHYWHTSDRYPYFISLGDQIAGFCLVRDEEDPTLGTQYTELAEFFVEKPFRHQGIGKAAFHQLLALHRRVWRVAVLESNQSGSAFWKRVLQQFAEVTLDQQATANQQGVDSTPQKVYWLNSVSAKTLA